jgi:hypothetical protein
MRLAEKLDWIGLKTNCFDFLTNFKNQGFFFRVGLHFILYLPFLSDHLTLHFYFISAGISSTLTL